MNTLVTLCLLAVVGLSHGSAIGVPYLSPAAISTANLYKAAPIPVVKTIAAPIVVHAPVPVIKTVGLGWDGLGLGGLGWGGLGYGGVKGVGWNGLGWDGLGWNGLGWNGLGYANAWGWGKH